MVDAQNVKNTDSAHQKGYDAGKNVSRHIAVNTQGVPHAIDVMAEAVGALLGGKVQIAKHSELCRHTPALGHRELFGLAGETPMAMEKLRVKTKHLPVVHPLGLSRSDSQKIVNGFLDRLAVAACGRILGRAGQGQGMLRAGVGRVGHLRGQAKEKAGRATTIIEFSCIQERVCL